MDITLHLVRKTNNKKKRIFRKKKTFYFYSNSINSTEFNRENVMKVCQKVTLKLNLFGHYSV